MRNDEVLAEVSFTPLTHGGEINDNDAGGHEFDRREFIRMTALTCALLLSRKAESALIGTGSTRLSHAEFDELPPGAVKPEGWLRTYMQKQVAELGSHLPDVSWPFTEPYWKGEEKAESWCPWEQKAYWIDGATRLAIVMNDNALMERVLSEIKFTLDHPAPNGYLGPLFFENPNKDFHRWPQNVFFRSLVATAAAKTDESDDIVAAMTKHYTSDPADYGVPIRNVTNIEQILWCYERIGDAHLLDMAENAWQKYLKKASDRPDHGDLSWMRVYANTPINAHGVTYAETCKLPAILYEYTGKEEYLKFALAAQRRIFDHHMLIDGIPSTSEWFRTRTSLDSHETCDISDHTWSWGYLMMATGDGSWGDHIERACFNAGPGAIKNDWKALQYFSCPNQFLATLNSDHNMMEHGGRKMAYQPNPGQSTACCGGNVHRLLPNYVIRMWMRGQDGGLIATLYGPSRLNALVGSDRIPIEIVQETNYPFEEQVNLIINSKRAVTFSLSLRIPGWCREPRLAINGVAMRIPTVNRGFITLNRRFEPGDRIAVNFPMRLAVSHWPEGGIGVERGPIVYSLPIKTIWTPFIEPKYATTEFPGWNAMPASPWNYGLPLEEEDLESQIKVNQSAMTDDPWNDPPITLSVPAKRIDGWELMENPDDPEQKFTPPLPDLSGNKVNGLMEAITLIPYGATELRVTIFPDLSKSANNSAKWSNDQKASS